MKRFAMTAALLLVAASASAAARAYDVRAVVEAIRHHSMPLSFIEADAVVRVVVDEQWPSDKLIAEVVRQSDRYSYAEIAGRPVLFAREPRYRLRVSGVKIAAMERFEAVAKYLELLMHQHPEFSKFQGWGYGGSFLGGTPAYVPLLQDKVTLTSSGEAVEHFAQLLGGDRNVFFDVGFFNWGDVERRSGIFYGRMEGATTQSPSDVVGRIHGKPVLRRETVRGDLLRGRVLGPLLKEYAVAKHIDATPAEIEQKIRADKEWEKDYPARLQRELLKVRNALAQAQNDEQRQVMTKSVAEMEEIIATEAARKVRPIPESISRQISRQVSRDYIRTRKIDQALWHDFGGGRVIFQQFGPEPLDAYRRFLETQQKKGVFEIVDKSLEASFWNYFRAEHHTFCDAAEGKRLMTTPWWTGK